MPSNNKPTVSVIIPVFNGARYIRKAIESVLNQSCKDFEIVVVDDGSTDETFSLIEPWIKDESIYYIHQTNKGGAVARNAGIRLAKGKFLKFLDCDDLIYPYQLEYQIRHLKNKPDHLISATDFDFEFGNKSRIPFKINLGKYSSLARFIQNNIGPPHSFLVHRSMIEKIGGFNEDLSSCQDSDLWLRVMAQGGVVERLDYTGCLYRILNGSVSSNPERQLRNSCKVFENLNESLLPQIHQLPDDVLEQLLSKNKRLCHICLKQKINPASYLSTALKVSMVIYTKKKSGLKKLLCKAIGIQNIFLLQYLRSCLMRRNYNKELEITHWRNEQFYTQEIKKSHA